MLKANSPGAVIVQLDPLYEVIFRLRTVSDIVRSSKEDNRLVVEEWKNNRKVLFPNSEIRFTNGDRTETVKILHILKMNWKKR
jgi:hypothetical protein